MRAVLWQYWFSTWRCRKKRTQGIWWQRELLGATRLTLMIGPNGRIGIVAYLAFSTAGLIHLDAVVLAGIEDETQLESKYICLSLLKITLIIIYSTRKLVCSRRC